MGRYDSSLKRVVLIEATVMSTVWVFVTMGADLPRESTIIPVSMDKGYTCKHVC